jgi:methylmalonyl-CoA/ethylmalonyl-CoA epimerase
MITHIHHINFIVKDLDSAVAQYSKMLGVSAFTFDSLATRAVKTARVKLGDTWLVLVQPINEVSEPARYLRENGEGFFLISLGTDDLENQLENWQRHSQQTIAVSRRHGLENWSIADLPPNDFFGVQVQLTEELSN